MSVSARKSKLTTLWSMLRQRYGIGLSIGLPVMGLFVLLSILSPAYYRAMGRLKLLPAAADPKAPQKENAVNLKTEMTLLQSNDVVAKTLESLKEQGISSTHTHPVSFRRSLMLRDNPETQTIALSFNDPNSEKAANIVNTHMEVFQLYKQQDKLRDRTQIRAQIDSRLPRAQADVAAAKQDMQQFQEKYQYSATTTSSSSAVSAYKQAQQDLTGLAQQAKTLESQRIKLLGQLGVSDAEADALLKVSQSNEFRQKITELQTLQAQWKRKTTQLTEEHPEVASLTRDIENLRNAIDAETQRVSGNQTVRLNLLLEQESKQVLTRELVDLETQRAQVSQQTQSLEQRLDQLKRNAVELPQIEQQYLVLERRLKQTQQVLDNLLQQRRDVIQSLSDETPGVQILSSAEVPTRKIAPFQMPLLWTGLATSAGLAGLGMWVAERRDRSLKTVADAEEYLKLRVLGVIPLFESSAPAQLYDGDLQRNIPAIFPVDQPGSSISEAFRMLYLNLKVLPDTKSIQSFAITSSIPQEGKSTIAANLAAVLSQTGKSVLLIDANLHHPFQSLIWNLPNDLGLSDILSSQTSFLLAVNPISSNLDILTSGTLKKLQRHPFESKQMKLFIADMTSRYDCVIFDLPSVNVSADAAIMSQMVDGVLFVSKPGQLDELNASKAQSLLARTNANLLGLILNGSDDPRDAFLPQDEDDGFDDEIEAALVESSIEDDLPNDSDLDTFSHSQAKLLSKAEITPSLVLQSLPELENQLDELQSQWASSKRTLDSKEEELIHLCHLRKELEAELNQFNAALVPTEESKANLAELNEKIRQADERRDDLQSKIKQLREQIKAEQNTFYDHLKVLQSQHHRDNFEDSPPTSPPIT